MLVTHRVAVSRCWSLSCGGRECPLGASYEGDGWPLLILMNGVTFGKGDQVEARTIIESQSLPDA
jgi:hypothetical protein